MLKLASLIIISLIVLTVSIAFSETKFVETDEKTLGEWSKKYGEDGYIFCNVEGPVSTIVDGADEVKKNDVAKLPDYISDYQLGGGIQGYVWSANDPRAKILLMPDGRQVAACWFTGKGDFTTDFPVKGRASYTMAVYIDDWENGGRKGSVALMDMADGKELAKEEFDNFGAVGKYAVFQVDRSVQLLIHFIPSYANMVVIGVFFSSGRSSAVNLESKATILWGEIRASAVIKD